MCANAQKARSRSLPTCNEAASNFTMTPPALPAVVTAGTYTDTLTVTITTQ